MDQQQPITSRDFTELHQWEHNPRNMNTAGFNRLKKQVVGLGRYKPLLAMRDGTILGGNMRHLVIEDVAASSPDAIHDYVVENFNVYLTPEQCQAIIDKVRHPLVSFIEFVQKDDQTWRAVVNGEEGVKPFASQFDGMLEYALSDNDREGYYDDDKTANVQSLVTNQAIFSDYTVDMNEPLTIPQQMAIGGKEDKNGIGTDQTSGKDGDKSVKCPSCGHEFNPSATA